MVVVEIKLVCVCYLMWMMLHAVAGRVLEIHHSSSTGASTTTSTDAGKEDCQAHRG